MHEITLVKGLMKQIHEIVLREKALRVVGVNVWLGALSHFTPDHFREHFEVEAKGTVADGAALKMEISEDPTDPNAQSVLLRSVDLDDA